MALIDIQLCNISTINRAESKYIVNVYSDDQHKHAAFDCDSELDAIKLRNAIREHASRLRAVFDPELT